MSTLVLDQVSKHFGGVVAADKVSMQIPPGRITGLIGPNGAGKSTIVNLITGMMSLTAGTVRLGERDLTTTSPHEISRAGLARTFQNIRLFKEAPAIDNVMGDFTGMRPAPCWPASSHCLRPGPRHAAFGMRQANYWNAST